MLVSGNGKEVGSVNVSPIPRLGEISGFKVLVGLRGLEEAQAGLLNITSVLFGQEVLLGGSFSGLVLGDLAFTPGVDRDGVRASFFDTEVVNTSDNLEETTFTPVSTPGVTDGPVFGSVFDTPTDDGDGVIDFV